MESGLSPQDKKDLDKFIKFFALKVTRLYDVVVSDIGKECSLFDCRCLNVLLAEALIPTLFTWRQFYLRRF